MDTVPLKKSMLRRQREKKKSPVLSATLFSRLLADFSDFAFVLGPTVFGEIGLK